MNTPETAPMTTYCSCIAAMISRDGMLVCARCGVPAQPAVACLPGHLPQTSPVPLDYRGRVEGK